MTPSSRLRSTVPYVVVAYAVIATGAVFLLISSFSEKHSLHEWLGLLFSETGMVLMAVGGAHIIYDKLLREETEERLLDLVRPAVLGKGLRIIDTERRYSKVYQRWTTETDLKDMFIIGRSVLHRMEQWANKDFHRPIESMIVKKLERAGAVTILFLDPRTPILDQLVSEEGRGSTMRADLIRSFEICAKLASHIRKQDSRKSLPGNLKVAVYRKNPTFAYHKQGEQMLIGFYPLKMKGDKSPVYEAIGDEVRASFEEHFWRLDKDGETTILIDYDRARGSRVFDADTIEELRTFVERSQSRIPTAMV
jgi:hypothetical protein